MAGQFAKPRSDPFEERDGVSLPSYRGDNVNSDEFTLESRLPNPNRMLKAYYQCSSTLNLLRAFATGGYASMQRVSQWNLDFISSSEQSDKWVPFPYLTKSAHFWFVLRIWLFLWFFSPVFQVHGTGHQNR